MSLNKKPVARMSYVVNVYSVVILVHTMKLPNMSPKKVKPCILCIIMDSGNGPNQEKAPRCFLFAHVQWMRELKPKHAWSHHKEGACGERDIPLLFPPVCPADVTERVG